MYCCHGNHNQICQPQAHILSKNFNVLGCIQTNLNENRPDCKTMPLVYKMSGKTILIFINKNKKVAPPCFLTAILTRSENRHNSFPNISESTLFPETKLTVELTWVLKFLTIIKSFWGKLYFAHSC